MDNKIQKAIDFAKQNPDSQYATELRKRIESGALDSELHSAGLSQYASQPKQDGILKSIGKDIAETLLVKPAVRATEAITRTVAPNSMEAKGFEAMAEEGQSQNIGGIDVEQQKAFGEGGEKQIAGEALKIGSFLFPYGKAASGIASATGSRAVGNIASGAAGGYMADVGYNLSDTEKSIGKSLVPGLGTAIGVAIPATGVAVRGAKALKGKIAPVKSAEETIGKIIQGTTDDIPLAKKALENIDTSKISTRKELSESLQVAKENLMNVVDNELGKDTRVLPLENYAIRATNNAGKEVKTDIVRNALTDLRELFTSTADDLSLSNLELLEQKAVNEGLTHQEVNNIARMYSQEFGAKAFNKIGDPLTSVTAQRFQNTRNGLKEAARGGLGFGEEAAQADRLYSAMENTQRLIDNGVEGVNKLQQRINERGLLEKLSRTVVNTLNTLSGGTLKGAASAVFPSNVGLKTLNWLDLENQLSKDLQLIQKANSAKTDGALVKALNNFKFPGDAAIESNLASRAKDFIKNPKMGMSIEDVSQVSSKRNTNNIKNIQPSTSISSSKPSNLGKSKEAVDNLVSEAKKYKTAEEFVKAKGDPEKWVQEYIKIPNKVYRGISETGEEGAALYGRGLYTSGNPKVAARYGKVSTLREGAAPLNPLQFKNEMEFSQWEYEIAKRLGIERKALYANDVGVDDLIKSLGHDGLTYGKGKDMVIVKYDNKPSVINKIQTKSQLTDIWKKANKK